MSARLTITVKPGSKAPGIENRDGTWLLRVRERAIDGAANDACVRALSDYLDVAPSNIALIRGTTSRCKTFSIDGITQETMLERITRGIERYRDEQRPKGARSSI